jgi:LacI family transcriptional regulator
LRFLALVKALKARGISMDPSLVVSGRSAMNIDAAEGYREMHELLDRNVPFTAVYAINDLVAMGAIRALVDRGLKVPEDVSVVGNDCLEIYKWVSPTLASMDGYAVDIGRKLMQQIIDRIASKPLEEYTFVVKYVPGESVGPAPEPTEP